MVALLFFVGWCVLGVAKIAHDVSEYRAQQAAIAAYHARYPDATLRAFSPATPGTIDGTPYDPALGRWLIGETAGYILTLAVVLIGRRKAREQRVTAHVRWIGQTREAPEAVLIRPRDAPSPSGSVAADRLSAIVWNDRGAVLEKEHA